MAFSTSYRCSLAGAERDQLVRPLIISAPFTRPSMQPACCRATPFQAPNQPVATSSRRHLLAAAVIAPLLASSLPAPPPAAADTTLPRAYENTARSLVETLRDAIDADLSGAPEREVRRRADPAKDLVRQFMTRWDGVAVVRDSDSYQELIAAIKELGEFYKNNGQRSRLSEATGQKLLARLERAEATLPPPEKKSLLPF